MKKTAWLLSLVLFFGVVRADDQSFNDEQVVSFMKACMQGKLGAKRDPGVYSVGSRAGLKRYKYRILPAELRDILREYEAKIATEEQAKSFPEGELKQVLCKWKAFKNNDDLKGNSGKAVDRILENRFRLFLAIEKARHQKGPMIEIQVWNDAGDIVRASRKTLHYKHPMRHRLQRLPANLAHCAFSKASSSCEIEDEIED